MEKINTESILSALYILGFEKVDPVLFTLVLGRVSIDNSKNRLFKFKDEKISDGFEELLEIDGNAIGLAWGGDMDFNISHFEGSYIPLREALHPSTTLVEYLKTVDFEEILLTKMQLYGYNSISEIDKNNFSKKEIKILKDYYKKNQQYLTRNM